MDIKSRFINTFIDEVRTLNGTEFEYLCRYVMEFCTGSEVVQKGHNLCEKPVGYTADHLELSNVGVMGQCGTESGYFHDMDKPTSDAEKCLKNNPDCSTIYLFSNINASGGNFTKTKNHLDNSFPNQRIILMDSHAIAEKVYANILCDEKVQEILKHLPLANHYYMMHAHSHSVPMPTMSYVSRPEEIDIIKMLGESDAVQVYGLSGIGKTQVMLTVAGKIRNQFEIIVWIDGESFNPENLKEVKLSRMNCVVNLADKLSQMKILLLVDNLNHGVSRFYEEFRKFNKAGSKCMVTSLHKSVTKEESYNLRYVTKDVAKSILLQGEIRPTEEQTSLLINRINGYPLLLNIVKQAVNNGDYSWDEIISLSNDLVEMNDEERNMMFAERIIGHYIKNCAESLDFIACLGSTRLCRFLLVDYKPIQAKQLVSAAIVNETDMFCFTIHLMVLESIRRIVQNPKMEEVVNYLHHYLDNNLHRRDEKLYTLMNIHLDWLNQIAKILPKNAELKRKIVLATVYTTDTFADHDRYLQLINQFKLSPEKSETDLSLYIERAEIQANEIQQVSSMEGREQFLYKEIRYLKQLLKDVMDKEEKSTIYHHIGKWYSLIGQYDKSIDYFNKAIECSSNPYGSHLQIARVYAKLKNEEHINVHLDAIMDNVKEKNIPLSILLAVYDFVSTSRHEERKKRYLYSDLDLFEKTICASVSYNNSQTYWTLHKLSSALAYNYADVYARICSFIPEPTDIDTNERVRYSYGCIMASLSRYVNQNEERRKRAFNIATRCLSNITLDNDYKRKELFRLYLDSNNSSQAISMISSFEEQDNAFNLQIFAKAYRMAGEVDDALQCINRAIILGKEEKTFFLAAFMHDKAQILFDANDVGFVEAFEEAISLQTNPRTIEDWTEELEQKKTVARRRNAD